MIMSKTLIYSLLLCLTLLSGCSGKLFTIHKIDVQQGNAVEVEKVEQLAVGMTKEQVDAIGQGRVWTGIDAKEIGLVDEIGGLNRAIEIAQETAKLENYKIETYPKRKDAALEFLMNLAGETEAKYLESKLGGSYKYYQKVEQASTQSGIMARMPFDIEVH